MQYSSTIYISKHYNTTTILTLFLLLLTLPPLLPLILLPPLLLPLILLPLLTLPLLLLYRYHDGMIAMNRDQPMITMKRLFYPKWWLQATGYFEHHGTFGPDTILFSPSPTATEGSSMGYYGGLMLTALLSAAATVAVTMWVLQNQDKVRVLSSAVLGSAAPAVSRHEYTPIASNAEL